MLISCSMLGAHLSFDGKYVTEVNQEQPAFDQQVNIFSLIVNHISQSKYVVYVTA